MAKKLGYMNCDSKLEEFRLLINFTGWPKLKKQTHKTRKGVGKTEDKVFGKRSKKQEGRILDGSFTNTKIY